MTDERAAKVVEMRDGGSTWVSVAHELDISVSTARRLYASASGGLGARLVRKAESVAEKVEAVVEQARKSVTPRRIHPARIERRQSQARVIKSKLLGEVHPRSLNVSCYGAITGPKAIDRLRVAMREADVDVTETAKLDDIVWDFLEEMDALHGRRG